MRILVAALAAFLTAGVAWAQSASGPLQYANSDLRPLGQIAPGLAGDSTAGPARAPAVAIDGMAFATTLDTEVLIGAQAGARIALTVAPETVLVFETVSVDGRVWRGRREGGGLAEPAHLAVSDTGYSGRFHMPDGRQGVIQGRSGQDGVIYLVDTMRLPPDDPITGAPVPPDNRPFSGPLNAPSVPASGPRAALDGFTGDDRPVIDILFVYTPQAEAARPSVDFDSLFDLLVASMNAALDISGAELQIRRAGDLSYSFDGDHNDLLGEMAQGLHPQVNAAQVDARADLVAYFGVWDFSEVRFCGIAWQPANPTYSQSLTHVDCALSYTFEHEVGHNIGMAHNIEDAGSSFRSYGHGFRNQTAENAFRTIMAYNCPAPGCARIPQFSTPDGTRNGDPTGTIDVEHNARVGTEQAATIASFRAGVHQLAISVAGAGVVRTSSGQACSNSCMLAIEETDTLVLTAEPDTAAGASFTGWSGACSGSDLTCTIPFWQAVDVEASFTDPAERSLIVEVAGTGRVVSDIGGLDCPGACTALFTTGQSVTLTADAPGPNDLRTWSGDCAGSGDQCVVEMSSTQLVQVSYSAILHPVSVSFVGDGGVANNVNSNLCNYINAPGCAFEAPQGQSLTLSVTNGPFTGLAPVVNSWGGDCAGQTGSSCSMTVSGPVTASVDLDRSITTYFGSDALGRIESDPAGVLNPGTSYFMKVDGGVEVTISAIAEAGAGFLSWSAYWSNASYRFENGCPESTGPDCTFTVGEYTRQLVANFGYNLTAQPIGSGSIGISDAGGSQTCSAGQTCVRTNPVGSVATLTAEAADGWVFGGWEGGACSGVTPTCQVTLSAPRTAQARFLQPNQLFAATAPGARSGVVGGDPVTAFVSVLASEGRTAENCTMAAPDGSPATLTYRSTNAANEAVGGDNPVFQVNGSAAATFVIALAPTATTPAEGYVFHPVISCDAEFAAPVLGVNSLALSIGDTAGPDIISIGATPSNDGVVRIGGNPGVEAFTAAAVNIGAGDGSGAADEATITVTADTGAAALPLRVTVCETEPGTGECLAEAGESVETVFSGSDVKFFTAFVFTDGGDGVAFDPANARVFLRFTDAGGVLRSETGAAVTAPATAASDAMAAASPVGRYAVQISRPAHLWPPQQSGALFVLPDGQAVLASGDHVRLASLAPNQDAGLASAGDYSLSGVIDAEGAARAALAGRWQPRQTIALSYAGAGVSGSIWGVYDARSARAPLTPDDLGEVSGGGAHSISIGSDGRLTGALEGCAIAGDSMAGEAAPGLLAFTVTLSGCARSGAYVGVIDEERSGLSLLLAGERAGWRLALQADPDAGARRRLAGPR